MADGSRLFIYGTITLPCHVRTMQMRVTFKVANITDYAILGIHFFKEHRCSINMDRGVLNIQDQLLLYTSRNRSLYSNKLQVAETTTVALGYEAQFIYKLTSSLAHPVGIIEHCFALDSKVVIAATLTQPNSRRRVMVSCLNSRSATVKLKAGTKVRLYSPVDHDQIFPDIEKDNYLKKKKLKTKTHQYLNM